MKILTIRGKNLASLEDEFVIDFTAEPLLSAGIFAITGSTGAGKSTILDALCLALFDETPRTSKAGENIQITDVREKTISQKDCRNILRRGAGEGYAEVDFMGLNGSKYRARWAVRRARGTSDGVLQNTEISLTNLNASTAEQGTKKELLHKITGLIGLTFEQFTRAVLLAQGDFATFLKAKQSEKAELLEKLTGTEVYSRISALIYRKAKEAESALELIRQRIKEVKLLTEEEKTALLEQKQNLEDAMAPLKKESDDIAKKLDWLLQETLFKKGLDEVNQRLVVVTNAILEAAPRFDYIELTELVQEIRDDYTDLTAKQEQQMEFHRSFQEKETRHQQLIDRQTALEAEALGVKNILDESEKQYAALRPSLTKARELDTQLQMLGAKIAEAQKEYTLQQKRKTQSEENIKAIRQKQVDTDEKLKKLSAWFDAQDYLKEIVPRADQLVDYLNDARSALDQYKSIAKNLESDNHLLKEYHRQLERAEAEAEQLNNILPSEVASLRQQLEEGMPCPVCGSLHHPIGADVGDIAGKADLKQLNQDKKETARAIDTIKEKIAATEREITRLEVTGASHCKHADDTLAKAARYLEVIPDWQEHFNEGTLRDKLIKFATQWNSNTESLLIYSQLIDTHDTRLDAEQQLLNAVQEELLHREEALKTNEAAFQNITNERRLLLNGKNVDEIESYYATQKDHHTAQYEKIISTKNRLMTEKATIEGSLLQIKTSIDTYSGTIQNLQNKVTAWLDNPRHSITEELLKELVAKSREWINNEKTFLSELQEQKLTLTATSKEREFRLSEHNRSAFRPSETESRETLETRKTQLHDQEETIRQQLMEIEVVLAADRGGEEKVKSLRLEFDEKSERCESWQKLNILLGSADGGKFKTIAQGYTLDILLDYANKHLQGLTGRYKLEKIPDTLALQVIDNDMLGEIRTVHSLSGGESFLISLSLALGLSSLSSNRMKIESLFIDEGFGSLDADTLSVAMDALENLQTQGRKIGVISHVAEMTERISAQIHVVKTANGKSNVTIAGKDAG